MKFFSKIAIDFASALVDGYFETAHSLLDPELRQRYSPDDLRNELISMYEGYSEGKPTHIYFDKQTVMTEWPDKCIRDIGWVYVSILGNGFVEAVSVIVTENEGEFLIREIEWGRP